MSRKNRFRVLLAAALILAAVAGYLRWSQGASAFPDTPLPALQVTQEDHGVTAELADIPRVSDEVALPVHVIGRAVRDRGSMIHQWPGFQAEARFRGTDVAVRVDDSQNRLRVTIDDGDTATFELARPGRKQLRISGLKDGEHRIRLEKISESSEPARFLGFYVEAALNVLAAPQDAPKLIEFVGDSDTVGYGNLSFGRRCTPNQKFAATDVSQSFGPRLAERLDASYRMIALSGIGLERNYGGALPDRTLPKLVDLALSALDAPPAAPEPAPELIVLAIGSNDFGSDFQTGEPWDSKPALLTDFQPALIQLARDLGDKAPDAAFILLAFGEYGDEIVAAYRAAEAALRDDGRQVALVILPQLDRKGCDWHPSPDDHQMIETRLLDAVAELLPGWTR